MLSVLADKMTSLLFTERDYRPQGGYPQLLGHMTRIGGSAGVDWIRETTDRAQ